MKFFATILFLLLTPVFLVLAGLILLMSGRPIFFKQERVGLDKKTFVIFKFRTMLDEKVTVIGRFLRKFGLDELPQLLNIIKGEMAFVGPRPLTQADLDRLGWNGPEFSERWKVKPGITGAAQLLKICAAELSLEADLSYIKNKCFKLDMSILLNSLLIPFVGKSKQINPPQT